MKVLSYVDGTLTVIDGNDFYSEPTTKPGFIAGTNFYYEPTIKTMDGAPLTGQQESDALAYINGFSFPAPATPDPDVHCIDSDGNYLGLKPIQAGETEVPSAPSSNSEKWISGSWQDAVLIDGGTGEYVGKGDTRTTEGNIAYAPNTLPTSDVRACCEYVWSGTEWSISLANLKTLKKQEIFEGQRDEVIAFTGPKAFNHIVSYEVQKAEANAWLADSNTATPYIDALLAARAQVGETKASLISAALSDIAAYEVFHAGTLGKFERLMIEIDAAADATAVDSISW